MEATVASAPIQLPAAQADYREPKLFACSPTAGSQANEWDGFTRNAMLPQKE